MKLDLRISPCPNDTFMFDAMLNGRIDTEGLEFVVTFADIEELNAGVMKGEPDISKISYATVPGIYGRYGILNSGSALGRGNGPVLVGRKGAGHFPEDRKDVAKIPTGNLTKTGSAGRGETIKIAVPGINTTANLLMAKFYPQLNNITPVLFSEIAERISGGEFDAGVLIHEGRFTYADRGLELICDLGEKWELETAMPLPLGAIAAARSLPGEVTAKFDRVLRHSIEFAMDNPAVSESFIEEHARELAPGVIKSHIALFVNEYSIGIGEEGKRAVAELTGTVPTEIFFH